jgi:hypothetical protein
LRGTNRNEWFFIVGGGRGLLDFLLVAGDVDDGVEDAQDGGDGAPDDFDFVHEAALGVEGAQVVDVLEGAGGDDAEQVDFVEEVEGAEEVEAGQVLALGGGEILEVGVGGDGHGSSVGLGEARRLDGLGFLDIKNLLCSGNVITEHLF